HDNILCHVQFQSRESPAHPWESLGDSIFTAEDGKLAGLAHGDNWRKYPRNMLFARALSNGARWYCPELFSGLTPYLPEEVEPGCSPDEDGSYKLESLQAHQAPLTSLPANAEAS